MRLIRLDDCADFASREDGDMNEQISVLGR